MVTTAVDPAAVIAAAHRLDAAADILTDALRTQLSRLEFAGPAAGRTHGSAGDDVHRALSRIGADVAHWAQATRELAAALTVGAKRYRAAEQHATTTLR